MSDIKRLVVSIVQFLGDQLQSEDLSPDAKESLEVAIQCLETAYNINPDHPTFATLDVQRPLIDIFTESVGSFQDNSVQNGQISWQDRKTTLMTPPEASEEAKAEAEKLKNEGNNLMKADMFKEALECYTKSINLDGRNAVYYCNRAAAYSKLFNFKAAIEDCRHAITIDPNYSKAYGRMGLAYASLNEHQSAKECYQKAVDLDPHNESYQNNLKVAEEKLQETAYSSNVGSGMNAGNRNEPLDFSTLLSNPTLVNMATQLMQDPNMHNLMAGFMSGSVSQGGGGMEALLQAGQQLAVQMQAANPELVEQLRRQMGNPPSSQNPQNTNNSGSSNP